MTDGTPHVGDTIGGKYVVEATLGRGGMGVVFRARHTLTDRKVALKWLIPDPKADPSMLQRFLREARAMGRIDHPNVVGVIDVETDNENAFLVMELQHGHSLRPFLRPGKRMTPTQAVSLLLPALDGVAAAHRAGVVHRDLKPENLFVVTDADDQPVTTKVLDFGISKLRDEGAMSGEPGAITETGMMIGTPSYMSPEQARGLQEVDARTDIWALGAILYEMLAGRVPFLGESYGALLIAIAVDPCIPVDVIVPDLPSSLARVVERALEKEPAQRFQHIDAMIAALEPFARRSVRPEMPSFPPPELALPRPSAAATRQAQRVEAEIPTRAVRPEPASESRAEPPAPGEDLRAVPAALDEPASEPDDVRPAQRASVPTAFPERRGPPRKGRWNAARYIGVLAIACLVAIGVGIAIIVSEASSAPPVVSPPEGAVVIEERATVLAAAPSMAPDAGAPGASRPDAPGVASDVARPDEPARGVERPRERESVRPVETAPPAETAPPVEPRSSGTGHRASVLPIPSPEARPEVSSDPGGRTGALSTEEF